MFEQQGAGNGSRYELMSTLVYEACARARCRAAVLSNDDGLFVAGWGGSDDELKALACGSPHVFIDAPRFSRTIHAAGQTVTLTMVEAELPPELDVVLARLLSS